MASRFPAFSSRSLRVQIALAVIAVVAIAAVHVALQTGFMSFGSGAGAERAGAEPQTHQVNTLMSDPQAGSARRDPTVKRGDAASR